MKALDNSGELRVFPAKPSECGRKGMGVICQQGSVGLETTYGRELDDTLADASVRVGDNETLERVLRGCRLRKLKEDMRQYLTTGSTVQVVLGAGINSDGEPVADGTPFEEPGGAIPKDWELACQLERVQEQDRGDILEALGQLLSVRKPQIAAFSCVASILVVPKDHRLCDMPNITENALQWDPRCHSIGDLLERAPPFPSFVAALGAGSGGLQQGAASSSEVARPEQAALGGSAGSDTIGKNRDNSRAGAQTAVTAETSDDAMPVDETFPKMIAKLQGMKRNREEEDSIIIMPVSATSSVSFNSNFDAENAISRDDREWAIKELDEIRGPITLTLHLNEPREITGIALAHRAHQQYTAFMQCYVQTPEEQIPDNKLTFTQDREVQGALLPAPFISQVVQVHFSRDQISAGEGTPGLRGIILLGREPTDSLDARKRR